VLQRATVPTLDLPSQDFPYPFEKPYQLNERGVPSDEDCAKHDWAMYYFTEATASAFQSIYDNKNGLMDDFANFWKFVASQFGKMSNVVG
jgi:endoglycosylceramidase